MGLAKITLLVLLAGAPVCLSCASNRSTTQLEEVAYVSFDRVPSGLDLQIDDGSLQAMKSSFGKISFAIEPGRRRIRVWDEGSLLIDREIFVSRGQTFSMVMP